MPLAFQPLLRGILYTIVTALILSGVVGLLTSITGIPESVFINNGIFVFSVFIGGLTAARMAGTKGLYYGGAVGIGVVLVIIVVSAVMLPTPFSWLSIAEKTLYALVSGAIGGIVGVALK